MATDILSLVQGALSGSGAIEKLSGSLGETPAATQSALQAGVPAMLAAMISKATSGSGTSSLLSLFSSGSFDGSMLSNLEGAVSGPAAASVMSSGKGIAQSLLGEKFGMLANALASHSGVSATAATAVLSLAGPLLMNAIGKASGPGGPTAASLTSLLSSQRDAVSAALPSSLGGVIGLPSLSAVRAAVPAMVPQVEAGRNWLWPVLLGVLVIGGLIYFLTRGSSEPAKEVANSAMSSATSALSTATDAAKSAVGALGEFFSRKLPDGTQLNIPRLGIENKLIDFIEDSSKPVDKTTWFDFDRLLFDTGKATLQPSSQEQLGNIAAILKAYPKVQVKIGGYTDNTGNSAANQALSADRANNVVGELVKHGVATDRLSAEGYGDQFPVADNSTEEGRAKNRRISLRVTRK